MKLFEKLSENTSSSSIPRSQELFHRAKKTVPGGVHSPVRAFRSVGGTPRAIASANGSELLDVDGHRYIDYCLSWGPLILGHCDPEVREAVQAALYRGWTYGACEPYSLELAELITSELPWVEKIRFVNSGTEAVMSALRIARAVTGREKILKWEGCYHGHADSLLVKAGSGLLDLPQPDSAGIPQTLAQNTLVCPLDDLETYEKILDQYGSEIAAVILEPVPANSGLLIQKPDFLQKVSEKARKRGCLVIFDEVITGFRVDWGGMAALTGIRPDLVTYGKIIGGGFPVGAYGGKAEWMDFLAPEGPVYQAGTLSANPVAMVAGLTTLKKLKKNNPYAALAQEAKWLAQALEKTAQEFGQNSEKLRQFQVVHFASLFWLVFHPNSDPIRDIRKIPTRQKEAFSTLFHFLLESGQGKNPGIYLSPSGYEVNFLSTAHSRDNQEYFVENFRNFLKQNEFFFN